MPKNAMLIFWLLLSFFPHVAYAREYVGGELIKIAGSDTVYYVGTDLKRYVFSTERVYKTWYENFDAVVAVSSEELNSMPLAGVVRYRPGSRMIKIPDDPKVYVVGANGLVRHIASEEIAAVLYGAEWNKKIDDVLASFFVGEYTAGAIIANTTDVDVAALTAVAVSISIDRGLPVIVAPKQPAPEPAPAPAPVPVTLGAMVDIEFAPLDSQTIYAASADPEVGLWKTSDGGSNWKQVYRGAMQAVAVHATSTNIVLASDGGTIKRSTDGGATWATITAPADFGKAIEFSFARKTPDFVFALSDKWFIKSENAGATWSMVSGVTALSYTFTDMLRVHPQNDNLIFAGSTKGLQVSDNGGPSWRESTSSTKYSNPTSYEFLNLKGFDFNNLDSFVYYMTTDQGLWYTGDNASSWNSARIPDVLDAESYDIEVADSDTNILYVATKKGVFKSLNRAQKWDPTAALPLLDVQTLAVDPKNENIVYAGTRDQGANIAAGEGLYKTTDGGATWSKIEVFN